MTMSAHAYRVIPEPRFDLTRRELKIALSPIVRIHTTAR
jgi:hypothetical protein